MKLRDHRTGRNVRKGTSDLVRTSRIHKDRKRTERRDGRNSWKQDMEVMV